MLENKERNLIEFSLTLSFPTSKNQTGYEEFLEELRLAEDLGAEEVKIFTDSQLIASQVQGKYSVKMTISQNTGLSFKKEWRNSSQ